MKQEYLEIFTVCKYIFSSSKPHIDYPYAIGADSVVQCDMCGNEVFFNQFIIENCTAKIE